ncbi:MAG TPA: glycine zipper 2TM domain-containing protein, partial [Burkholderiaceae bacterium]
QQPAATLAAVQDDVPRAVVTAPQATLPAQQAKPAAPAPLLPQATSASVVRAPAMPAVAAQPTPVCHVCGTVESVTAVQRAVPTSGVGAVAGGVVGGLLGNQVGGGSGRAAMTVLGAVGGGFAGNAVEHNMKKRTVYQVHVRMQNGSLRTFEQATAPAPGTSVVVEAGRLRTAAAGG